MIEFKIGILSVIDRIPILNMFDWNVFLIKWC